MAASLVGVGDDEGHLGLVGTGGSLVASDRDDLLASQATGGRPVVVVDGGEPAQVAVGDARVGGEVAQVAGAGREPGVELDECVRVGRLDRAQVAPCRRPHDDIGLPVRG